MIRREGSTNHTIGLPLLSMAAMQIFEANKGENKLMSMTVNIVLKGHVLFYKYPKINSDSWRIFFICDDDHTCSVSEGSGTSTPLFTNQNDTITIAPPLLGTGNGYGTDTDCIFNMAALYAHNKNDLERTDPPTCSKNYLYLELPLCDYFGKDPALGDYYVQYVGQVLPVPPLARISARCRSVRFVLTTDHEFSVTASRGPSIHVGYVDGGNVTLTFNNDCQVYNDPTSNESTDLYDFVHSISGKKFVWGMLPH